MGHPITINKKVSSLLFVVCSLQSSMWMLILFAVLIVKLNLIDLNLDSLQLDALQKRVGQAWFFCFISSLISLCSVETLSKHKINFRNFLAIPNVKRALWVVCIAYFVSSVSICFSPPKSVCYIASDCRWHFCGKGYNAIQTFEDSLARTYVWNNMFYTSTFSITIANAAMLNLSFQSYKKHQLLSHHLK